MSLENEHQRDHQKRRAQRPQMDGSHEEFINEYDADETREGMHSKVVPARAHEARSKNSFVTALGKILSFLHR